MLIQVICLLEVFRPWFLLVYYHRFNTITIMAYVETINCLQPHVTVLACFYALSVNGVYEDLSSPQASAGVGKCLAVYKNIVTLYQQSYLLISKLLLSE